MEPIFQLTEAGHSRALFHCGELALTASVSVLAEGLFHVLLRPDALELPNTWAVARDLEEVPFEGLLRDALPKDSPELMVEDRPDRTILTCGRCKVETVKAGLLLNWFLDDRPLLRDRRTGAYNLDGRLGRGMFHYTERLPGDLIFGLGEKAGNVVKNGGHYVMKSVDCMGYDAQYSDPLYKHIPWVLIRSERGCCGVYYDTGAECVLDLGREHDNYHPAYRYFRSDDRFLDYYVLLGEKMRDVVPVFSRLGGVTAFPPRWTLGYLASSMGYTDSENAQERLTEFLAHCRQEDIPLSGFHLSSGYTSIHGKRYVFHWNKQKFPDPEGLSRDYRQAGVRLIANIKPCLLEDHPDYGNCAAAGRFVRMPDGSPAVSPFWGARGSCLDFTAPQGYNWWRDQVQKVLLERGIEATWNDNNEFEIWDEQACCAGTGRSLSAVQCRTVLTLLMLRASREAQRRHAPHKRPYLITRAGGLGLQRYAQTWTGDNYTDWKTLRFNHRMGLGLSLSGIYNFGHDIGGFSGPKPEPELFVRWVQAGIFLPRFSIHSWNDDGTENEPWMYPEYTAAIRDLIRFRYQLLPYLYTLLYRAAAAAEPIIRPLFYEFDHCTDYESDAYLLGPSILVCNVFDPGVTALETALPAECGWYDPRAGRFYQGGSSVRVSAALTEAVPVFIRAGSVIPLDEGPCSFGSCEEHRLRYHIFPLLSGTFETELFWDDGYSEAYRTGQCERLRFRISCTTQAVEIKIDSVTDFRIQSKLLITVTDCADRPVHVRCTAYPIELTIRPFIPQPPFPAGYESAEDSEVSLC